MSIIKFPYEQESNHPQYLWNEQEYIIRMLMQHSIGISMEEISTQVTVSHNPALSHNFTANGPADFPSRNISASFSTSETCWIYLKADGSEFYLSGQKPFYNQYIHGWYHPTLADRAVVFIDSELAGGIRCMVMDSANVHFDYNRRIRNEMEGIVVYHKGYGASIPTDRYGGDFNVELLPGRYRFHLRGGRGGNGGAIYVFIEDAHSFGNYFGTYYPFHGGSGAIPPETVYTLTILDEISLNGYVGFDGEHGDSQNYKSWSDINYVYTRYEIGTSGAGGSSGEDTYIQSGSILLSEAIGGAGGGGSQRKSYGDGRDPTTGYYYPYVSYYSGAGGGGAGAGIAENGIMYDLKDNFNPINLNDVIEIGTAGMAGTLDNGGAGALADTPFGYHGEGGQDRIPLRRRRNGGDSFGFTKSGYTVEDSLGGRTFISPETHGYIKIVKVGDVVTGKK
jgi:hypothetical protein